MDGGAIRSFVHLDAQVAQADGHGGQAIGFLDPQLRRTTHHGLAAGTGSCNEQRREFVDHVRHDALRHFNTMQRRVSDHQVGHGLTAVFAAVFFSDVCAHRAQGQQKPGATRVQPYRAQAQVRAGNHAGCHDEEGGRRKISRHRDIGGTQTLSTMQTRIPGREFNLHAESSQHAFGVVTGRVRFAHHGFTGSVQARQQHRRLDLGTGHFQGVIHALQSLPAVDA